MNPFFYYLLKEKPPFSNHRKWLSEIICMNNRNEIVFNETKIVAFSNDNNISHLNIDIWWQANLFGFGIDNEVVDNLMSMMIGELFNLKTYNTVITQSPLP